MSRGRPFAAWLATAGLLRTVCTKAQDGPQHPGADALERRGRAAAARTMITGVIQVTTW
ncbi:hypothetical protein [Actinomadura rudentiformis]|uniref:hypothetical protein n=1 Tax=Actinomadura rudentiformis TaxID=359158 RepID=UPI00178C67F0|nr:hypothetical protein [Actinomadura rudentiformis]